MIGTREDLTRSLIAATVVAMLRYLGTGRRWYARKSIKVFRRGRWEFQAVIDGRIAPMCSGELPLAHTRSLWVFDPNQAHGWTGVENEAAEVVVFHFVDVPEPLASLVRENNGIRCDLTDEDIRSLREWSALAAAEIRDPGLLSALRGQRLVLDLSVLVLERLRLPKTGVNPRRDMVDRAIAWYRSHLENGVGVSETAAEVGISASHLRRLFHEVMGACPKTMFEQMRMQRAVEELGKLDVAVEEVASRCGYASASAFSRAFSAWTGGTSPRAWRSHRIPNHSQG